MISQQLYDKIKSLCANFSDTDVQETQCASSLAQMDSQMGTFDIYNVYDTCLDDQYSKVDEVRDAKEEGTSSTMSAFRDHISFGGALNDFACGGDRAAGMWLQQQDVADALHVDMEKASYSMQYTKGPMDLSGDLRPLYKDLIQKYRMLIYSGDVDGW